MAHTHIHTHTPFSYSSSTFPYTHTYINVHKSFSPFKLIPVIPSFSLHTPYILLPLPLSLSLSLSPTHTHTQIFRRSLFRFEHAGRREMSQMNWFNSGTDSVTVLLQLQRALISVHCAGVPCPPPVSFPPSISATGNEDHWYVPSHERSVFTSFQPLASVTWWIFLDFIPTLWSNGLNDRFMVTWSRFPCDGTSCCD